MKAAFTPAVGTVAFAPVSESKSQYNFRMTRLAAKSVENFLAGKHTLVREVFDRFRLSAFAGAAEIGQTSVGNVGIAGPVANIKLSVVKIVGGRLMLQGVVPSAGGTFRTFDCGKPE